MKLKATLTRGIPGMLVTTFGSAGFARAAFEIIEEELGVEGTLKRPAEFFLTCAFSPPRQGCV